MSATRCARGPSLGAATLAACGKTHAAFDRRSIPAEPRRVAALCVAFRSKYTRASSPGGGSSLTRLVGRAPRPHREDWLTSALTWVSPQAASRGYGAETSVLGPATRLRRQGTPAFKPARSPKAGNARVHPGTAAERAARLRIADGKEARGRLVRHSAVPDRSAQFHLMLGADGSFRSTRRLSRPSLPGGIASRSPGRQRPGRARPGWASLPVAGCRAGRAGLRTRCREPKRERQQPERDRNPWVHPEAAQGPDQRQGEDAAGCIGEEQSRDHRGGIHQGHRSRVFHEKEAAHGHQHKHAGVGRPVPEAGAVTG